MKPEKLISYAKATKDLGMTPVEFQYHVDKINGPVYVQVGKRKLVQVDMGSRTLKPAQLAKGKA